MFYIETCKNKSNMFDYITRKIIYFTYNGN